jgi:aryl-alcohol dehydrogenase-like predicted oxidoreductase
MNYRRLGDAGVRLSEIGLGGWLTYGNAVEQAQTEAIVRTCFEVGINFFDSANAYAGGRSEAAWGQILRDYPRSSYVLATKVFFPMGEGPNDKGLSRKHIFEQCDASLKRLQTEYIDLYQCHRFDPDVPLEETIRAMDDLVHRGKVLYWGISEWPVEQIERALEICAAGGYYAPKGSQPHYNAIHRKPEEKLFPLCAKAGIGNVVFSPLAQGVLTGKYKPGASLPTDSRAADDRQNRFIKGLVENTDLLARVQKLEGIARDHNCSMAQLALAWILRRPEVTSCIIGASRPQQVKDNAAASGIKLDEATVRRMEEILA